MDLAVVSSSHDGGITIRYKECMRNHAASIGGHANDGCGEFMPRGHDNTRDSLSCAACGCHRSFHRRELPHRHGLHSPPAELAVPLSSSISLFSSRHPPHLHYHDASGERGDVESEPDGNDRDDDRRSQTPDRVVMRGKRFRTKFTWEQKERMQEFAERIGWRMNRNDNGAFNRFCSELGIKRNVLKVWMHNNKNAHRRRQSGERSHSAIGPQPSEKSAQPLARNFHVAAL